MDAFSVWPEEEVACRCWPEGAVFYRESDGALFALDPWAADCLSALESAQHPLTAPDLRDRLCALAPPDEALPDAAWFDDLLSQLAEQGIVQVAHA